MKLTKYYQLLAVAGVLATGAVITVQPASAQSTTRADAIKDVRYWENQVAYQQLRLRRARTRSEREDAQKDLRNAQTRLAAERRDAARFGVSGRTNYNRPGKPNNGWGYGRDKDKNHSRWNDHDGHKGHH